MFLLKYVNMGLLILKVHTGYKATILVSQAREEGKGNVGWVLFSNLPCLPLSLRTQMKLCANAASN